MTKLIEINKLLIHAKYLSSNNIILKKILLQELDNIKLISDISGYNNVLKMCIKLGLIHDNDPMVIITDSGLKYLDLITENNKILQLDSNSRQRRFLFKQIIKSTELCDSIVPFLPKFNTAFRPTTTITHNIPNWPNDLFVFMSDMQFIDLKNNTLYSHAIKTIVQALRNKNLPIPEKYFARRQERLSQNGKYAENLTLDYERTRLINLDYQELASAIEHISISNISAGYDICSFNGFDISPKYDRFIEVKGTGTNEDRFYWTENEIKIAEQYLDHYWIYHWKNIFHNPELTMIPNAYEKIFNNVDIQKIPMKYKIKFDSLNRSQINDTPIQININNTKSILIDVHISD